jgi:TetR/AcrR family transcriptional regulator
MRIAAGWRDRPGRSIASLLGDSVRRDATSGVRAPLAHRVPFDKSALVDFSGRDMILSPAAEFKRKRGRPRQHEGPDPEKILQAALSAFAQYGWAGTDLRRIAQAAGVDSSLIARRYDGKVGLWRAIVDNVSTTMKRSQALDGMEDLPVREQLRVVIERFVTLSLDQPDLGRFFIDQIAEPGERRSYVIEQIWAVHRAHVMPLLECAAAEGLLPPGSDPERFHAILVGAVAMPLLTRSIALPDIETEVGRARFMRNIMALFHPDA